LNISPYQSRLGHDFNGCVKPGTKTKLKENKRQLKGKIITIRMG